MAFPIQRLRRLRQHETFRRMVQETRLSASDLIYPMFVLEGKDQRREDRLDARTVQIVHRPAGEGSRGGGRVGNSGRDVVRDSDRKNDRSTSAVDPNGIVQRAIKAVKDHVPGLIVVTDVCIDDIPVTAIAVS